MRITYELKEKIVYIDANSEYRVFFKTCLEYNIEYLISSQQKTFENYQKTRLKTRQTRLDSSVLVSDATCVSSFF